MAQVAFDPQGNALAIWERSDGAKPRIEAAGYDAAGPLLANLAAPATVVAGRPVAFSVTLTDSFSAVAATSWSFGDGTTASGAATSAARTIRVEPAPNVETALRIEGLSITPRRFAPVGGAVASRARKGGGTTIHYRLSEAARVSFAVERAAAGRRWCAPALGSWGPLSVVVDLTRWRRTRWLIPN